MLTSLDTFSKKSYNLDGVIQRLKNPHVYQRYEERTRSHHGHNPPCALLTLRPILTVDVVLAEGIGGDKSEDYQDHLKSSKTTQLKASPEELLRIPDGRFSTEFANQITMANMNGRE